MTPTRDRLISLIKPEPRQEARRESPMTRNVRRMANVRPEALDKALADIRTIARQPHAAPTRGAAPEEELRRWRIELQKSLLRLRVGTMTGARDRTGRLAWERPAKRSPASAQALAETMSRLIQLERIALTNADDVRAWAAADFETESLLRQEWLIYVVDELREEASDACQTGLATELEGLEARMSDTLAHDATLAKTLPEDGVPRVFVPVTQTKALTDAIESALGDA